jgi:hypothetical protein
MDAKSDPGETQLPALLENTAFLIKHYLSKSLEMTAVAKYFIRALARQDMMLSLTHCRRPMISTAIWLDEECRNSADRFMGYTATLMPLLEELSALAEDVLGATSPVDVGEARGTDAISLSRIYNLSHRAADLRARIDSWRWPNSLLERSFRSSRKLLLQAYAYRSAALLYLHRLFHPPDSSAGADQVALGIAHDILVYTNGPPEEVRMLLWPVFVAACDLANEDDRSTALQVFDSIYKSRKTATSLRTKEFCVNRVWAARDTGMDWNWMTLVRQYPGECVPI